jgi:IS5 family transposase
MVKETKQHFANLEACSFDKGFHSRQTSRNYRRILKLVVLPRKGKLSQQAQAAESAEDFVKVRRQHSAVESAINALEVHGLDYCPDHGIYGFKRYVALAVVARNIHRIGAILRDGENRRAKRKTRYADRDMPHKMAA